MIYHLAPAEHWETWPADTPYLPPEYAADGFIHCTQGDDLMLTVANHFYRSAPGDFVLLVIDEARLTAPLRWETADDLAPSFPHIYGPLNHDAIVAVRPVRRASDGTFEGWQ